MGRDGNKGKIDDNREVWSNNGESEKWREEERGKEVNKVDVCHKAKVEPKGVDQLPLPPLFSQK